LYDTPRSARSSTTTIDSERAASLYDVPKSSQVNLFSGEQFYDTPPPSRALSVASSVSVLPLSTSTPEASVESLDKNSDKNSDNESVKSSESKDSKLHYSVQNQGGSKDVYSRPSIKLKPPELPPRNTPRSSLHSELSKKNLFSPDYMDMEEEEIEELETFQLNAVSKYCNFCYQELQQNEKLINSNGNLYHPQCFVCAQCFQPFQNGEFFEFEGRKYCRHDFQMLYAACCAKCSDFIIGRVIKALSASWHPECFTCDRCDKSVSDIGFAKIDGKPVCKECAGKLRDRSNSENKPICRKCSSRIDGDPLRFQGNTYHPYHFNCNGCGVELTSTAREVKARPGLSANKVNELYCLRCHDKMNIPICGACRRPIEERVVTAMGKHWHVDHFACAFCEKPFRGNMHYEKNGLAYCYYHFNQLFGALCYHCNGVVEGDIFSALGKSWCGHHFSCSCCNKPLGPKSKFFEVDLKPVCKKCYEKFPRQFRLQLKKYHDIEIKRAEKSSKLKK